MLQKDGFAAAAGTYDRGDGAGRNRQVDPIEHPLMVEAALKTAHFNCIGRTSAIAISRHTNLPSYRRLAAISKVVAPSLFLILRFRTIRRISVPGRENLALNEAHEMLLLQREYGHMNAVLICRS